MQQVQAYEPSDDLRPYEEILDQLTHRPIEPHARARLAELYREGYLGSMLHAGDFPATQQLWHSPGSLEETAGLLDSALLLHTLGIMSEGIAIGREHGEITTEDVDTVAKHLCDRWPDCARMRTAEAGGVISRLVRKIRGEG